MLKRWHCGNINIYSVREESTYSLQRPYPGALAYFNGLDACPGNGEVLVGAGNGIHNDGLQFPMIGS